MTALERAFRCALLTVLMALAVPVAAQAAGREFKVMVFTRAVGEQHASTAAGVKAIKDLGKERRFIVNATADPTEFRADRLAQFRAVVFLNTSGDVLTDAQQTAFEDYYRDGGGFVGIHSAIDTERDWAFLGDILGTRSTGAPAVAQATVKVADRVHDASKSLPEYWQRTDEWYDFAANVRG
ncbi:MAG TPA: ThuA domain-containing protein, partial [Solirubrobacteraceae bacterium]|nr:ThuA domain-containing protein [Solirubrobacteraceae bacterium]